MTIRIRPALPDDVAAIATCLAELGYETPAAHVAMRLSEIAGSARDVVFVAEDARGVVGVASVHAIPLFHSAGDLVRLTALSVRGDAQRTGAGRALVATVEAWARARGALRVELTSGAERTGAHAFYERIGYAVSGKRFIKHLG